MAEIHAVIHWTKGSLSPAWTVTVLKRDKTAYDLTGATFAGALARDAQSKATAGTYANTTPTSGVFTYTQAAADVAVAGKWIWDTKITIASRPVHVLVLVDIEETYA